MRNAAIFTCAAAIMIAPAAAQLVNVAQQRTAPQNELDLLSRSSDAEFPELESEQLRQPVSVTIRALNKITARYIDIEAVMDEVAEFGALKIVPKFCDKRPPEEFPETTAFLQIYDLGLEKNADEEIVEMVADAAGEASEETPPANAALERLDSPLPVEPVGGLGPVIDGERIFSGWMFASSPALNALEHPVYDIWVIDCTTAPVEDSIDGE